MQLWGLVIGFILQRKQCICGYNVSVGGPSATDVNTVLALKLQSMMNAEVHGSDKDTQGS